MISETQPWYKVFHEKDGKLVSTHNVPEWLRIAYPFNTWVQGIDNSPVFVTPDVLRAKFLASQEINHHEQCWVFLVRVQGIHFLPLSPKVWIMHTYLDQEVVSIYRQKLQEFWKKARTAWKCGRDLNPNRVHFNVADALIRDLGGVHEYVVDQVRLLEPLYIVREVAGEAKIFHPYTSDLDRIGWVETEGEDADHDEVQPG